ncbi:MAG: hypothetical protein JJT75_14770 [Opitutales bacterium]|nr:hypothetical protein [Opitutales bacterium]MCH8541774.1 hypothetical protein [Opitutales bacterium]
MALVGSGVYWFFLREEPLVIESVTPREKITVETDLQPVPVVADVYAPNSGFGTYWSARNSHPREGVSLGQEVVIDWDSVEPRTIDLAIPVLFNRAGMRVLPDAYQDTVPRIMNRNFAREEADFFKGSIRTGGARRDFYRRYFWVEARLGMLEENLDKWWAIAKEDSQRSVREPTRSRLRRYFSTWERNPEMMLKLAELMMFHSKSRERQESRVDSMSKSAVHFRRDEEALHQYVTGMTELLDRLESEMREDGFDLTEYREQLNRYTEHEP